MYICNNEINRDYNGSKNIFLKSKLKIISYNGNNFFIK